MIRTASITLLAPASAVLCACATETGGLRDSELAVMEHNERIPIHAVETTAESRQRMRDRGHPVMLVKGQPEYLYWDSRQVGTYNFGWKTTVENQLNRDIHGCVVVSYDVRADGKTDGFEIEESTPAGVFDQAALRAALITEYEPLAQEAARQSRAIWFLVAKPRRTEASKLNDEVEADRNARREEQRVRCEGKLS